MQARVAAEYSPIMPVELLWIAGVITAGIGVLVIGLHAEAMNHRSGARVRDRRVQSRGLPNRDLD